MRPRSRVLALAVMIGAATLLAAAGTRQPREGREPEDAGPYPSDWFYAQRAFPADTIPYARWRRAVEQARVERAALPLQEAAALTWQEIGPYNVGGRVTAIAAPPGGTPVYVGSAAGGVFKSTNAGVSFTPLMDQVGVYSIGAVELDPSDPNVIYVGTGEANSSGDSYPGAGVFKSTDGGATWQAKGLALSGHIGRFAIDPTNTQRIYAAAMGNLFTPNGDRGLYRSLDGGDSWSRVLFVDDSTGVVDVALNPATPSIVYAASWERRRTAFYRRVWGPSSGIWRSTNGGGTWTRLAGGLPNDYRVGRISLSVPPAQPNFVHAQIIDSSGIGTGFYRSTDSGLSWTRRDVSGFTGAFGGFGWYFGTTAVHPTDPNIVWGLGQILVRSNDGGVNWSSQAASVHVDFHDLWIDPSNAQRMYAGSDGGFFSTTNGGASWTHSIGLPISQFYAGDVDQQNVNHVIGGTQDNSTPMTMGGLQSWVILLGADGFYALVDPVNSSILFAESQNGSGGSGPFRSTNGGDSFSPGMGIGPTDFFNWSAPYAFAPGNSQTMVFGSHRVYLSTNQGVAWQPISPDLSGGHFLGTGALVYGTVTSVAIAASDANTIYAGTDDGRVWVTRNRGSSWTNISAGLPLHWVTRVTVDPTSADRAYVTLSGYTEDEPGAHVFRTTNAGVSWTNISSNLPNAPVNDLVADPADASRLYLGTDVGVYGTVNQGASWFPLGSGMPVQPAVDLVIHAASHTLIAFTHGRSAWKLDLSELVGAPPGPPPVALALDVAPNPTRGAVALRLELPAPARVSVGIFDAMGRRVADLGERSWPAGMHRIDWDGRGRDGTPLAAGVYYARARAQGIVIVRPIQRLR